MSTVEDHTPAPGSYGVPIGLACGLMIGLMFGSMTDSLGIWVIGGLLLGVVAGLMFNRKQQRRQAPPNKSMGPESSNGF